MTAGQCTQSLLMSRLRIGTPSLLALSACQSKSQDQPRFKWSGNSSHSLMGRGIGDVDTGKCEGSGEFLKSNIAFSEISPKIKKKPLISWELQRDCYQLIFGKNLIVVGMMSSCHCKQSSQGQILFCTHNIGMTDALFRRFHKEMLTLSLNSKVSFFEIF